jgi:hypothetical protein
MKLLRFPVKGFGGLSLMFSEALVIVVPMVLIISVVSTMVSSWYQSFSFGVGIGWLRFCSIKVSGCRLSWCRGVEVRCKNMGAFVGESTLLLDFKMFKQNV